MSSLFYFVGIFGTHPRLAPARISPGPHHRHDQAQGAASLVIRPAGVSEKVHKKEHRKLYDYFRIISVKALDIYGNNRILKVTTEITV